MDGLINRSETTVGNVTADVLGHSVPGCQRGDFVEVPQGSGRPE